MPRSEVGSDVRELRLALVCYGGVSLAIYMHGVTKEIQKLVEASAALEGRGDGGGNPFDPADSAHAYWELLRRLRDGEVESPSDVKGLTLRVVVDVISGTSAGGINGVCLAKTLAGNRSQDALRDLWMERGDIAQLLPGPSWFPRPVKSAWTAVKTLFSPGPAKAPLNGDAMCQWLQQAFSAMDDSEAVPGLRTLLPSGHELELFVTLTDFYGYERDFPLSDPKVVRDLVHRHLMVFRHCDPEGGTLGSAHNDALAFAARGTSALPGAFEPISFQSYAAAVGTDVDVEALEREFFPQYRLAGTSAARTQFVDGGVLDNAPFGSSIAAIGRRPAVTEVDRRLMYVEPDPGEGSGEVPAGGAPPPSLWKAALAGYASIPRKEPILDDLQRLCERNADVLRIRDVIESNFENVSAEVGPLLDGAVATMPEHPDAAALVAFRQQVEARAEEYARAGYCGYLRVRVRSVVDAFASAVSRALGWPSDSNQARFVLAVLRQWAGEEGLLSQDPGEATRQKQRRFLDAFDVGYHERRVRLLIAALNWWYREVGKDGFPSRASLGAAKEALYAHLEELRAPVVGLADDAGLVSDLHKVFSEEEVRAARTDDEYQLSQFVERHSGLLDAARSRIGATLGEALPRLEDALHSAVLGMTAGWGAEVRGAFMTRYLGFPIWDTIVYPLQAVSRVGERDHVEVYRVSPRDVALLGEKQLKGMELHHFGAFFDRAGRERDYLWGRLDCAERLVRLLLDCRPEPVTVPGKVTAALDAGLLAAEAKPVLSAILAGEREALPKAASLIDELALRVEGLAG